MIDTLYKQIIMTRSIPFSLSVPSTPVAREEMDEAAFSAMMMRGLREAKQDQAVRPLVKKTSGLAHLRNIPCDHTAIGNCGILLSVIEVVRVSSAIPAKFYFCFHRILGYRK